MYYDFNKQIERKGTNSLKYDFTAEKGKPQDILPLWVADMDFQTPQPVIDALIEASSHGVFGYTEVKSPYFKTVQDWYRTHFNWETKDSWLVKTPGVVFAICTAIRALTEPGDAVLIQRPVYYPFSNSILDNERTLINNSLCISNGRYTADLDDFEAKIKDHQVKLFILCNPHNPVGRVWTQEELTAMGDICMKYNVTVVSDEIHGDFIYPGYKHTVFAGIKPEFADIAITCTAPSKTFNLAGLQVSNVFISNQKLRAAFRRELYRTGYSQLNTLGLVACQTAYEKGNPWLESLRTYLSENLTYIKNYLKEELPQISLIEPEGTYLIWLDFRGLGLTDNQLEDLIVHKAKLWLDRGTMFGPEGEGFQRINIACTRATLERAFSQLKQAVDLL
jgi:cystathionine beta-lyase